MLAGVGPFASPEWALTSCYAASRVDEESQFVCYNWSARLKGSGGPGFLQRGYDDQIDLVDALRSWSPAEAAARTQTKIPRSTLGFNGVYA